MSIDLRRPDLLTLHVRELDRALAFWNGVLRIPIRLRSPARAELQTETTMVILVEHPDSSAGASPALGWEVDDLPAALARLAELGVEAEVVERAGARAAARFRDPDGHVLELVQLHESSMDDGGSTTRAAGTNGASADRGA